MVGNLDSNEIIVKKKHVEYGTYSANASSQFICMCHYNMVKKS